MVNSRIKWSQIAGSAPSLAGFIQNLTNEKYYGGGIALSQVFGANAALVAPPRTWGVEASYKF